MCSLSLYTSSLLHWLRTLLRGLKCRTQAHCTKLWKLCGLIIRRVYQFRLRLSVLQILSDRVDDVSDTQLVEDELGLLGPLTHTRFEPEVVSAGSALPTSLSVCNTDPAQNITMPAGGAPATVSTANMGSIDRFAVPTRNRTIKPFHPERTGRYQRNYHMSVYALWTLIIISSILAVQSLSVLSLSSPKSEPHDFKIPALTTEWPQ